MHVCWASSTDSCYYNQLFVTKRFVKFVWSVKVVAGVCCVGDPSYQTSAVDWREPLVARRRRWLRESERGDGDVHLRHRGAGYASFCKLVDYSDTFCCRCLVSNDDVIKTVVFMYKYDRERGNEVKVKKKNGYVISSSSFGKWRADSVVLFYHDSDRWSTHSDSPLAVPWSTLRWQSDWRERTPSCGVTSRVFTVECTAAVSWRN